MENLLICFSSCLCLSIFIILMTKFLDKVWWTPLRIQSFMNSQGIKGPSYRFLHGNTKEIIKMISEVRKSPQEFNQTFLSIQPQIYSWIKLYGMNYIQWYGSQPQLMVTELELIKEILNDKEGVYLKPNFRIQIKKLLGDGIVTSRGEKWLKMKKLANHAFNGESLKKNMIPEMIESSKMMLERWRHQGSKEIDVFQELKILASEIISRTAFGSSYLEGQHIFDMLTKIADIVARTNYRIRIPGIGKFVKTQDDTESEKMEEGIRNSVIDMIRKRDEEAKLGEGDGYGKSFLGLLLKAYHDPDKTQRISIDDLIDECKTFYVSGHETTASSLSWTVLLLAIHTDWQDKTRKEVLELFGQQDPSLDGIAKLKIMSLVINESLRIYPPAAGVPRRVERQVQLGKLTIPANMELYISTLALHQNPEIWGEDVHLFKPERFAEGVAKATNNNMVAFVTFGSGPRSCIGSSFAIAEIKIVLAMILQRYRFTLSPTYAHSPIELLTVRPQHGIQLVLQPYGP